MSKIPPPDRRAKMLNRPDEKEVSDLRRLLRLVSAPFSNQQFAGNQFKGRKPQNSTQVIVNKKQMRSEVEAVELEKFSMKYKDQRLFSGHPHHSLFSDIFAALIKNRLNCSIWQDYSSPESILRVLICLRLLIREPHYQKVFYELHGLNHFIKYMESISTAYLENKEHALEIEQLVNMTYVCQKLAMTDMQRKWLIDCEAHMTLGKLLSSQDRGVLLGTLLALNTLADSPEFKEKIGELSVVENLLVILQEYDMLSKRLCAELLRLLCSVPAVRQQVCEYDGVPVLLSMLHADHLKLLWSIVWVLVQLCQDSEGSANIRAWGGIQQLLRILNRDRVYVSDHSSIATLSSANAAGRLHAEDVCEDLNPNEDEENMVALHAACCTAITELVLDDAAAQRVVQENGVYILAQLILPHGPKTASLQCNAFRTLRFLFSMERNRYLFKRLFPPELFEMFIDIGHYVRDITAYVPLQERISSLSMEELDVLRESIEAVNQNHPPLKVINSYSILHPLGSGAFGTVFKVRKQGAQNCLALKEVSLHNPAFGHDKKSRDSNIEKIVSELTIIKEQMKHPNIVKYFKTFLEDDRLYIVMELVEGASLAEHFSSHKEKQQNFTEEQVWNIFIQMCLALRYLHKEKRIIHRDLTPNNIMLGERDKVTITDFGLAKQKQETSKLTSVVGTILYSCPEMVKSEPYGEKADVWAAGCVLYQMVTLRPPFYSNNMLSLATKIVEAEYEPVKNTTFSERVIDIIKWCLTPEPDLRPDIVEVSSRICDLIMKFLDGVATSHTTLEKRAERNRRRAQKYCMESNRLKLLCCRMPQDLDVNNKLPAGQHTEQSEMWDQSLSEANAQDFATSGDATTASDLSSVSAQAYLHQHQTESPHSLLIPDNQRRPCGGVKPKARPGSAGICISHRKVRQIDDPNLRLLELLHKLIFITQLPPAPQTSSARRTLERFKKSLFQRESSPVHLKMELSKVLQGSQELIELCLGSRDRWATVQSGQAEEHGKMAYHVNGHQHDITYEQIQVMIEEVLEQNAYYSSP